jgi:hypothetical protein
MADLLIQLEKENVAERKRKFAEKGEGRFDGTDRTLGGKRAREREEAKGDATRFFEEHFQKATPERKACLQEMKKSTLQESGEVISLLAGLAVMKEALTADKFM